MISLFHVLTFFANPTIRWKNYSPSEFQPATPVCDRHRAVSLQIQRRQVHLYYGCL